MEAGHRVGQIVEIALSAVLLLNPSSLQVVAVVAAVLPIIVEIRDGRRWGGRPSGWRHHPGVGTATVGPAVVGYFSRWKLRRRRGDGQGRQRPSLLYGKRRGHVASRSGAVAAAGIRRLVLQRRMRNRRASHNMHP